MVKFDIVSGFLGAGKTTLIRQILEVLQDEKVVIIENEYGETQIDKDVLSIAGFEIYELTNGCICCTLKADFYLTLKQILDQKVDRIIFEPSGIFVLSEIFELFKDLQISSRCSLNSIVTVVDGVQFNKHINIFSGFFLNQIEQATSLVISKAQFIDNNEENKIIEELRRINPNASIKVLYDRHISESDVFKLINKEVPLGYNHIENNSHSTSMDHQFDSFGIETIRTFEVMDLEQILHTVKIGGYGHVFRGKGIVKSSKSYLQFNYVDGHYEICSIEKGIRGAVSFIGMELKKGMLKEAFQ